MYIIFEKCLETTSLCDSETKGWKHMRFEEGRLDQFVSLDKSISTIEKENIIQELRDRQRDALHTAITQVKDHITGEADTYEIPEEDKPAFILRSEEAAKHGYQWQADNSDTTEVSNRQKPTWLPLIVFGVVFIAVIIAMIFGKSILAVGAFFAAFAFFGFYSFYKGNARGYTYYGGTTSGSGKTAGLTMGLIGLAGIIPLFFSGKYGTKGTLILMSISLFSAVAISMLAGFILSLGLKDRKYKEEVSANCVGYSRIIETGSHRRNRAQLTTYLRTSPIFEYTYQGKNYKGIYDRMIDGLSADVDIGPARIFIDPDHPEDIYHKSAKVKISGLFVSVICAAIAVLLVFTFKNGDFSSGDQMAIENNINAFSLFKLAFISDDEREAIIESMADGIGEALKMNYPAELTDEFIGEAQAHFGTYGEEWYYEKVKISTIYEYDNQYNIEFEDKTLPQLCHGGKPENIGDEWLIFYTIEEYEFEGEKVISKDIFFDLNANEHTYVGTHGAYEG